MHVYYKYRLNQLKRIGNYSTKKLQARRDAPHLSIPSNTDMLAVLKKSMLENVRLVPS
jgi:hypothetical protein